MDLDTYLAVVRHFREIQRLLYERSFTAPGGALEKALSLVDHAKEATIFAAGDLLSPDDQRRANAILR